jgi:hypothetical protein
VQRLRRLLLAWPVLAIACGGGTVAQDAGLDSSANADAPEDPVADVPVYCTLSGPVDAMPGPDVGTVTQCSPGQICSNSGGSSDYLCCLPASTDPHYCQ